MTTAMDTGTLFDYSAEVNSNNVVSAVQALMKEVKRGSDALADRTALSEAQLESVKVVVANMKVTQDVMAGNSKMVADKVDMLAALDFGVRIASIDSDVNTLKILLETEIVP